MKFNEQQSIEEVLQYVIDTYGEHYSNDDHQFMDDVISANEEVGYCRWSAIKYLKRYGKKEGYNKNDLMKSIHFILMLMNHNQTKINEDMK